MGLYEILKGPNKHEAMTAIAENYYKVYMDRNVIKKEVNTELRDVFGCTVYDCGYANILYPDSPDQSSVFHCAIYVAGSISVFKVDCGRNDGMISANFSGCYMGAFTYNNERYVAHISKESDSTTAYTKWIEAIRDPAKGLSNIISFRPTDGLGSEPNLTGNWGLITPEGDCYRIEANEVTTTVKGSGKQDFHRIPNGCPIVNQIN